jgi:autotransporter-associated beta strand protein
MNLNRTLSTALALIAIAGAFSARGQTTVYEQSRLSTGNNPDFTYNLFTSTVSANKSTAPGIPAIGSPGSRIATTGNPPAAAGAFFQVSPNNTTAGQLVIGTTYAVAITFGSTGNNESSDLVVTASDTGTTGNDTFAGITSAFKNGNGYNTWITVGNITVSSALPTIKFTYLSGVNGRWYVDTIRFTPLPPTATPQYWDLNGSAPGIGGAGPATWDTSSLNWNSVIAGTGTPVAYIQANLATFGGTPGIVNIDPVNGITTDGGLEFDSTNYVINSGPLTLGFGTNIAVVGSGNTATINSVITGTNGLCTTGLGTLVLGTNNNLTGTVTISSGVLKLGTNQTFSSLAGNPAGNLALVTNTLTVGDTNNTSCNAVISDAGAATPGYLIKQGSGTLALNGASTFHGTTTVAAGALSIASDAAVGTAPSSPVANQITLSNAGRLDFSAAFTLNANRGITLGSGGGLLSTGGTGTTPTIAGTISGAGDLIIPSGGFDLTGTNTFTGNLYFVGTNVDATGNGLSSVRFDSSTVLAGAGKIFVSPGSSHNITLRTFSYTNAVVTNAIQFDQFTNAGLYVSGAVASGKLCTLTLSGNFNGTGRVIAGLTTSGGSSNPGGTVALAGDNSAWSGGLTLQYGNLDLGSRTALGTGTFNIDAIDNGASLVLMAGIPLIGPNAVTNSMTISLAGGTTFTIGGTNSLEISGPVTLNTSATITVTNTGASILSGGITNATPGNSLMTAGSGTLTLSGASTYDGGTTVSPGSTLIVNNTTGSGTGTGLVIVNGGGTLGGSGIISGTVEVDGTISPGNSPGTLATADETWAGGGSYTWEINRAGGTAGANPGWDLLNITGGLTVLSGFTINLNSLTLANATGPVADFNHTKSYTWSIAHTTTGVSGFSPELITLNTVGFANSLGNGTFFLSTNATDVLLSFAVPPGIAAININVAGNTVAISGTNGPPNVTYRVLTSTNVTAPLSTWSQVGAGTFGNDGSFSFNGAINPANSQGFYAIVLP